VGKIAALLQAKGLCVGSCGVANVLQLAWGVVFPNATIGRKVRGGKKLKPLAVLFAFVEIFFVILFSHCQGFTKCRSGVRLGANVWLNSVVEYTSALSAKKVNIAVQIGGIYSGIFPFGFGMCLVYCARNR